MAAAAGGGEVGIAAAAAGGRGGGVGIAAEPVPALAPGVGAAAFGGVSILTVGEEMMPLSSIPSARRSVLLRTWYSKLSSVSRVTFSLRLCCVRLRDNGIPS